MSPGATVTRKRKEASAAGAMNKMVTLVGCDGGSVVVGAEIEKYSPVIKMLLDPESKSLHGNPILSN